MLPNYSPKKRNKKRKTYIGNKGLGFRSIVNWSKQITILTNNMQVDFSYKISQEVYKKYMNSDVSKIAFLSLPKVENKQSNNWTTSIIIKYKDKFINDIQNQLDNIKDEVLLFVNHLEKLTIVIDDEQKIIERIKENNQIYLNDTMWTIFQYTGETLLPKEDENEETEHFDLKIAIKDEINTDEKYLLYSFFPTEINIDFPFVIHGTFELEGSRNNITISNKNKYILEKLINFIVETAKELTQNSINYQALEFLIHDSSNQRLKNLKFYDKIDDKIKELAIFPCLDNTYKAKDGVIFISDDFSDFIEKNNFQDFFPNMLISSKDSFINDLDDYISNEIDLSLIDEVSKKIDNIDTRVEFIYLISILFNNKDYSFEILIDEDNQVIEGDEEVYTPVSKDYKFNIPEFVHIKFINLEFYEKLLNKLDINSNEKSRDLQRKLKNITNIQSYEPAQVLQKIITSTNKIIEKENNKVQFIKEMVLSLYENFKFLGERTKIPENTKIQILSKTEEIKNAKELFLSKSYPSGKLTEFLFEDIFEDSQFLINKDFFGFKESESEEVERFFEWLGVNKFTKFEKVSYSWNDNYDKYLFEIINKPDNYSKLSFEMQKIAYLEQIKYSSIEKFIIWCLKDNNIQAELSKNYQVKYVKSGGYIEHYLTGNAPSYILYQLYKTNIFKDYLITNEKLSNLVNDFNIDFENEEFKKYNIKKPDIQSLILKLGAVEKFQEMTIERIRQILKALEEKSPDGKQTQTIYKAIRNHQQSLNDISIKLCAKKNGKLGYYEQDNVYYVNTSKLPKRILDNIPIINIPPRLGKVIEFFGIKDVKNIEIKIMQHRENINLTNQFNNFFDQIRSFILVYRFESLKDIQTKENDLNKLKKSKLYLCEKVVYSINGTEHTLENNDYIKSKIGEYFIKVNNEPYDDIRRTLDFRETFADIIGSIFNIANIKDYDRLISDEIIESEEIIKREYGYEALQEAREYLNIADEFFIFWRTIYKLVGKTFNDKYKIENINNIKQELELTINIDALDYKNINSMDNHKVLQELFEYLKLSLENFNREILYMKIDFTKFHQKNLENYFNDNNLIFEKILYPWCLANDKRDVFIDLKGKYENADKKVENILSIDYQNVVKKFIENNFDFSLESKQTTIDFNKMYDENLLKLKFEIEELTNSEKSLLYFEDGFQELNTRLEEREKQEKEQRDQLEDKKDNTSPKQDNDFPIEPRQAPTKNKYNSYGSAHNPKKDKQQKEKGNKAEQCVFNKLVDDYGESNVKWISKESDNKHYDIRYKNKSNKWIYVEVKIFSNNMFYITKDEKKLADKEKESYEIFLLDLSKDKKCENSCIRKIIKYSELEQLEFIPNKYEVYFTIKAQQNTGTNNLP